MGTETDESTRTGAGPLPAQAPTDRHEHRGGAGSLDGVGDLDGGGDGPAPLPVWGPAPGPAAWAFVLGGLLYAVGTGLRWFAPGYDMDMRLDDRMSPVVPGAPELTAPGSVPLTAAGLIVLAAAWILLAFTRDRGARRWWLALACALCAAYHLTMGIPTARAALTGAPASAVETGAALLIFLPALGVPQLMTALVLLAHPRPARLTAACLLMVTPLLPEFMLLSAVYPSHDDPGGSGVLTGTAYLGVGLALLVDRAGRPRDAQVPAAGAGTWKTSAASAQPADTTPGAAGPTTAGSTTAASSGAMSLGAMSLDAASSDAPCSDAPSSGTPHLDVPSPGTGATAARPAIEGSAAVEAWNARARRFGWAGWLLLAAGVFAVVCSVVWRPDPAADAPGPARVVLALVPTLLSGVAAVVVAAGPWARGRAVVVLAALACLAAAVLEMVDGVARTVFPDAEWPTGPPGFSLPGSLPAVLAATGLVILLLLGRAHLAPGEAWHGIRRASLVPLAAGLALLGFLAAMLQLTVDARGIPFLGVAALVGLLAGIPLVLAGRPSRAGGGGWGHAPQDPTRRR